MKENNSATKTVLITNVKTGEVTQGKNEMAENANKKKSSNNISVSDVNTHKNDWTGKEEAVDTGDKNKPKRKEPESIEEFLELFFDKKIKALSEKLARSFNLSISEYTFEDIELIKKCLNQDRSLEKTKQLLLLLIDHKQPPKLEKLLKDVVRKLIIHSEVNEPILNGCFPLMEGQSHEDLEGVWRGFVNSDSQKEKPAPELIKARKNVFFCAVLWQLNWGGLSFKDFIKVLNNSIFSTLDKKEKTDHIILEYLSANLEGKNCKSLSFLFDWFYKQTDVFLQKNAQLLQGKDSFEKLFNEQRDLVLTKDDEINVLKSQVDKFQLHINEANEKQRVEKIHLQDDQRKQKGRTLRAFEEEIPMLQDALKALEREPAKIAVAKDCLGRALDNLNNELEQLRKN